MDSTERKLGARSKIQHVRMRYDNPVISLTSDKFILRASKR